MGHDKILDLMINQSSAKPTGSCKRKIRPRYAHVGKIVHPQDESNVLDTGVSLWFPGPKSYTGEDMAEFHVHGGVAVVSSIMKALGTIPNVRMAEAGEFSRRAFDNDKMDLTTLEGVADLINAETEAQRKLAVRQAHGELYEMYEAWRKRIVGLMAKIEAFIDFSEDENIEDDVYSDVCLDSDWLINEIKLHLDDKRQGEIMRNGVSLSIVGPPNSGKSTLLNRLAQRQVAIVSPIAGTTRDIVETTLDIGGYPLVVRDTAGLRSSSADVIETEGIRRAVESAKGADIRLFMLDARKVLASRIGSATNTLLQKAEWREILALPHTFVVLNMADALSVDDSPDMTTKVKAWAHDLGVANQTILLSCVTMYGWDCLMQLLAEHIQKSWGSSSAQHMPLTKLRHRQHLKNCLEHLDAFRFTDEEMVVLGAEELRKASKALGRITGRVDIEDVLDALFSEFCIGK
ncbi:mitochondrial splicing system protein [Coemansia sp. RSA 988]|nr:mitochondrial splicing system protein [Coemansia sp. RSA 988]